MTWTSEELQTVHADVVEDIATARTESRKAFLSVARDAIEAADEALGNARGSE